MTDNNMFNLEKRMFAIGYYDGRAHGSYSNIMDIPEEFRHYYEEGYWSGVSDYSEYDAPKMAGG